jgi:3-keto-disaccharide hydrolase
MPTVRSTLLALVLLATIGQSQADETKSRTPFLGSWAFELPDGNPAWLRTGHEDGTLTGSLLWSVGSARPVQDLSLQEGTLTFFRKIRWKPYGRSEDAKVISKPMTARLVGDELRLTFRQTAAEGGDEEVVVLDGKRMPPMPARPDPSRVAFGDPIQLFNGRDLTGWRISNPDKENGWRAEDGVLVNETPKTTFAAYGDYGNLCTERKFEDFELTIDCRVEAGGNSGVYLRGMYEAQVVDRDSRMQGIAGPGAIFGRIAPSHNAGKPGGQWNRYQLTLVDRHITVVLNGQKVIDNRPLEGCTGGGLSADDTKPGPIFLQGDHTSVQYRNIVLRPVIRDPAR